MRFEACQGYHHVDKVQSQVASRNRRCQGEKRETRGEGAGPLTVQSGGVHSNLVRTSHSSGGRWHGQYFLATLEPAGTHVLLGQGTWTRRCSSQGSGRYLYIRIAVDETPMQETRQGKKR